ncbi:IclR family transcriptional regulator [Megasphaera cerevisiae DSM 20462]|jgi:DNA-binding IclR family transcriptional regulator|uniref:IclR family transcriptional regulator n=1 Tax=Megasphaera cerevisiae DSM 20462 TaxID=1122219 RepID=A0A0J6WWT8_9FIRM|nr:IclR family transcriptional regulator [Megasphaera cerevisiae]KMO87049.1 IclR family transcriptional regulator [Megasphaera cerevisiae DSM 20462]OKY52742.1 IclR family transcriptional regulator [Megasphaera cerevisiae]SJZ77022.1 transcriptional regulator, IclR family [Megasphaera cerevisiae DSM 20462]
MSNNTAGANTNNSIVKAVQLLNTFSMEKPRLRLKEISVMTGISQPTAYRMLSTLKQFGLVEQHGSIYSLGLGLLRYESIVLNSITLRRVCMPYLEELSLKERINVNLAVLEGDEVLYVARAETPYCRYGYFHVGMRRPVYCTALGKVLVYQKPELIERVFAKGVIKCTMNTITDETEFRKEIETVKLQGYATDLEEWTNGSNCIAAPVFDLGRRVIGGISISGPVSTYSREQILGYRPILLEYANRVSLAMQNLGESN